MNYCRECGKELVEGNKFCLECGHPVEPVSDSTSKKSFPQFSSPKKKLTKKQKLWWGVGIIGFLFLVTTYIIASDMTSKPKLVQKYETAVGQDDAKALADLFIFEDSAEKVDEEGTQAFLDYLKEYPEEAEALLEELQGQLDKTQSREDEFWDEWLDEDHFITIVQDGKFLFFDRYRLAVEPVYVTLHTDYKGTKVSHGEKEVYTASADDEGLEYGPLFPGIYQFAATYKNQTADLNTTEKVELWGRYSNDVYFQMEADTVTFLTESMPVDSAKLYVNGQLVDFDPFSGEPYGPVMLDGSLNVEVEAEFPWGVMKSDTIALEEQNVMVTFEFTEEMESEIAEIIGEYYQSYLKSFETLGELPLKHVTADFGEDVRDSFSGWNQEGHTTQLWVKNLEMSRGNKYLMERDSQYFIQVDVRMEAFESHFLTEDGPGDPGFYNNTISYSMVYDDGWKIDDEEYFSMDFEEDFKETVPIMEDSGVFQLEVSVEEIPVEEPVQNLQATDPAQFVIDFRNAYAEALNAVDFSIAEDYLLDDSTAYHELKDYMETEVEDTFDFNFTLNKPLDVETKSDGATVLMHEKFIFTHNGDETYYDREKEYTLIIDEDGNYKIEKIDILETGRD
ncbi:zinc ribbon domain-containing protein [Halobacillus sp. Nhm2S1]|uniref:zinc ribbon domain-containing protein n=1 Tax=Halobacillus sp. Nhm2S1 TaxID=2866716 RepID=UPI001C73545F|nr:zinc-ribbon domain-containing protein [Halobacillus sp. Nhm2S1]MBX0357697.1 zinc-ribbon domain-containing protein [Halobacillus sp. Nhm2S1]